MEIFTIQDIILFVGIGCFGGFLAGLLGVGGGVVYGPAILIILKKWNIPDEILFPLTFGTSLFIIIFTSFSAVIKYQMSKSIIWRAVFIMSFFSILGALVGVIVVVHSPAYILQRLYGLLLFFASYRILKQLTAAEDREPIFNITYLAVCGFIIGIISSTFGVGGGIIGVPLMILVLRFPVKNVAGTSSAIIVFTSIAGVIRYVMAGFENGFIPDGSFGFVNIKIALPFMAGAVIFAPVGAYLNGKVKTKSLKVIFAVFLISMGVKLIFF